MGGEIVYRRRADGRRWTSRGCIRTAGQMRAIRGGEIGMIFQEPMTSLSPIHPIGWQIGEPLLAHGLADRKTARAAGDRAAAAGGYPRS